MYLRPIWPIAPQSALLMIIKRMETKKTWEKCLSRAYHSSQALALPQDKDKQRKACPRQR